MSTTTRRLRAFKRWMRSHGIEYADALDLSDTPGERISVRSRCDLSDGDVVATIPKHACLTIKNSGGRDMIEAAGLDGNLGLAVAIMYEKSIGHESPWAGYLQVLPQWEALPLMWTLDEVDALLSGTEIYEIVKEDKALVYEDWKECILPLVASSPVKLDPNFFGVEQYFAAKSLIASRSFQIDDYHGSGMVPLADLFNHKTGAEDVHFTAVSSHHESDNDEDLNHSCSDDESFTQSPNLIKSELSTDLSGKNSFSHPSVVDDCLPLEMIIVKDVKAGTEVYNTYGSLGNAALLHRYGFTEPDNLFDIVNIDIELILRWSSSLFSRRYTRARLSLWRRLNFSGCVSENSEYFEISSNGEPQIELLILLYILLLAEDAYSKLDFGSSMVGDLNGSTAMVLLKKTSSSVELGETPEISRNLLLTKRVRDALSSIADIRESLYGSSTIKDDMELLRNTCSRNERALFHSLTLRLSERKILEKLRRYATNGSGSLKSAKKVMKKRKSWA